MRKNIFNNLSFEIKNNSFIGISGRTGTGKTTLLDLISLLIEPSGGKIELDNRDIMKIKDIWQKIAYVPQNIYLSENSILNNIIIDNNEIPDRVKKLDEVLKLSCCDDFIKNAEYCIENKDSKKLLRLSGGQIQRLGIRYLLYIKIRIFFY